MSKDPVKPMKMKYLMFENDNNFCWLDATLSLVAHNTTIKKIVENSPESQILKIISAYTEAIGLYNKSSESEEKVIKTKKILLAIQCSTSKYLNPFLKFKTGEPESAFCALLNLIYQDKSNIKELLNVSWIWRKQCLSCGVNSKSTTFLKPIITLSKVETFHPECPTSIYTCVCKSEQEMKLIYKELPPCLIFHFEKGVNTESSLTPNFSFKGREYQLTSIIILEKSIETNLNHFVTWIRNPVYDTWLECNDLNTKCAMFTPVKPEFALKDLYIAVFEAFDSLDKIKNDDELSVDQEQDVENSNVELINLSDEEAAAKDVESSGNACNQNASECNLKHSNKLSYGEIEANSDYQSEAIDELNKSEELKAEIGDFDKNEVRKDSTENKNETSNSLLDCKVSTVGNLEVHNNEKTEDNAVYSNSNENIFHNFKSKNKNIDISKHKVTDASENNKEKFSNRISDTTNGNKVEDKYASSSTGGKERFTDETVCSDKIKNAMHLNDDAIHSNSSSKSNKSLIKVFQNVGNPSVSKDFDSRKTETLVTDNTNIESFDKPSNSKTVKQNNIAKAKHSSRKTLCKEDKEKIRCIVDKTIDTTFANFFKKVSCDVLEKKVYRYKQCD